MTILTQRESAPLRWLFIAATFASALLIFLVQPMVGKRILPWFGGAPAVWALCLAFYQTTLFIGYAYAHLVIRLVRPRHQLVIHSLAVAATLTTLPVLPGEEWKPSGVESPSGDILAMLFANVALPFLILASTGPLMQAWFSRRFPNRSPYPLYAVSNIGSLLALLVYPFVLEPRFGLAVTERFWSVAFALTAFCVLACAAFVRSFHSTPLAENADASVGGRGRIDIPHVALWLLLPGCAVVVLMGVTNSLCLDVASVPFLWILPLSTYLITFIVSFSGERTYRRIPFALFTALALVPVFVLPYIQKMLEIETFPDSQSLYFDIASYCALLFGACMLMHGELYRLRPAPRVLTAFYLCVSGGGALGGLFVGIAAPVLFDGYYELQLGLALAWLLVLAAAMRDDLSIVSPSAVRGRWVATFSIAGLVLSGVAFETLRAGEYIRHQERGFFGVLRVGETDDGLSRQRVLIHGSTTHGLQFTHDEVQGIPTLYFGRATGIGLALTEILGGAPKRVGLVGLGVGTLATYGRAGDQFRFYEIDPEVVRIARDDDLFSYLSNSEAEIEVVLADGRLALANERNQPGYEPFDVLIIDAFSSDAIPVHLLTREAFVIYAESIAPNGLLAVHASNRYFHLMPLVARLGLEVGLASLRVTNDPAEDYQSRTAQWVLLSRDQKLIRDLERYLPVRNRDMGLQRNRIRIVRTRREALLHVPVWTDDYSDLFSLLLSSN